MKNIKKLILALALFCIEQKNYTSGIELATDTLLNSLSSYQTLEEADRLIAQAYITPYMQWTILKFCEHPYVIDLQTRMPVLYTKEGQPVSYILNTGYQAMPTIREIILKAKSKNLSAIAQAQALEVLQTALQAIDLAMYVAAIEASYDSARQNYYFYQTANGTISNKLTEYKAEIEDTLKIIQGKRALGSDNEIFTYHARTLDNPDHIMMEPASIIKFLEDNDFKKLIEPNNQASYHKTANLLIKQAFIAQQLHLKDRDRLKNITPVNGFDLKQIYESFPDFHKLLDIAKNMPTKLQTNIMFKHIRQAVLTAIFLAKRSSNYYITSDPLITELKNMETKVTELCNNPLYGATQEDLKRDFMWTSLTNIALGAGALALAGAAIWAWNDPKGTKETYNEYVQPSVDYLNKALGREKTLVQRAQETIKTTLSPQKNYYATSPSLEDNSNTQAYSFGTGAKAAMEDLSKHQFENDIIQDNSYWTQFKSMLPNAANSQAKSTSTEPWAAAFL